MKTLFKNYNYSFDKNDAKIISTFCKQAIKQMSTDERFMPDIKAYQSIISKIDEDFSNVKLTKDEKFRLLKQLQENVKHYQKEISKAWFIKKWLYKSMLKQYDLILTKYFEE
ncbi:MAG: hypothetical protein Fur0015_09790 [Ignavibacteriales bacterium]